jgi:hypothetical protein
VYFLGVFLFFSFSFLSLFTYINLGQASYLVLPPILQYTPQPHTWASYRLGRSILGHLPMAHTVR